MTQWKVVFRMNAVSKEPQNDGFRGNYHLESVTRFLAATVCNRLTKNVHQEQVQNLSTLNVFTNFMSWSIFTILYLRYWIVCVCLCVCTG